MKRKLNYRRDDFSTATEGQENHAYTDLEGMASTTSPMQVS